MEKICCLLIGYIFGCFLTAEAVCMAFTGNGTRANGLDNPGMASVMGLLGVPRGLLVLFGDMLKTVLAIVICRFWFFPALGNLAACYAGFGAVVGHCYPIFSRFRGGKGIAVTGAWLLLFSPAAGIAAYLLGGAAVLFSRYLAIGSAVIAVLFPTIVILQGYGCEASFFSMAAGCIILLRHIPNFRRIRAGRENKFDLIEIWQMRKSK